MPDVSPPLALAALVLLGATALLASCGDEGAIGAETDDWGKLCATGDECPGALDCLCGVCTVACTIVEDRSGCPFGTCLNAAQIERCGAAPPAPRTCGVRCVEDEECKNLGAVYICDDGVCARPGS